MRTITVAQQAVIDSGVQGEFVRFSVKDSGGTYRDLTTYPGFNAVKLVSWKHAINDPHGSFDVTLMMRLGALSLAPLMTASALNRGFNPAASYAPLLAPAREAKIEVAIVPMGSSPQSGDWMEVFRGRIDKVNASGEEVAVSGRSLSGRLAQQYIKTERVYAFAADSGTPVSCRVWSAQMVVVAGEYLVPASRGNPAGGTPDPGYNKFFKCHTGGTTGTVEPTWTTGTLIADGATVKWDYVGAPSIAGFPVEGQMQLILNDNKGTGDSTVTLNTVGSSSWNVTQWLQQRGFTWDALSALAGQLGWDLRDKFDEGSSTWKLTFYEPDRAGTTAMHTFGSADHGKLTECSVDVADIRNSIRIIYKDKTDLWPDGTPKRKVLDDADSASVAKYLELWAEIQEDETSNIDTPTEAGRLRDAFLSDCSEPDVVLRAPLLLGFPWAELNDLYAFQGNAQEFDSTQTEAVTEISHAFAAGKLKTELGLRGKPTAGHQVHLDKIFHPEKPQNQEPHRFDNFQGPKTAGMTLEPTVGGARVKVDLDLDKNSLLEEYELHVSDTPGFTPDASTLVAVGATRDLEVGNLIGGFDYYARLVPRVRNRGQLARSQPSVEQHFVAGQANAGHLHMLTEWGRMPLNGGFETWNDTNTLPDHWKTFQTWGTNFTRQNGSGGVSGDSWLRCVTQAVGIANIFTEHFTIEKGTGYELAWWANITSAGTAGSWSLIVNWFDYQDNFISGDTVDTIAFNQSDMTVGTWARRSGTVTAPDGARYASVQIKQATNGDMHLDVDSVRFDRA